MANSGSKYDEQKPRILYIDMAYTLKMVKERELEQEFASRDCGGYFDHVWGVHPVADIPENRKLNYEGFKLTKVEFSSNQTIIEGLSAYYSFFRYFFPLNFFLSQIRFVIYLIKLVRRERISIVFCTDPYFSGLIGLFIKWFTKAKLIIWVVGNNDEIYEATGKIANPRLFRYRWIEKIIEKRVFRGANLVAGSSQNNLEFALNNGAKLNKSTIFPVGKLIHRQHLVEPALRDKDELFNASRAKFHFIYVGRLIDLKYPEDVLQAFNVINQAASDCALIMAGNGPMMSDLEKLASEMGIHDKVYFLGNVNQIRLANLLANCFAVLSPLTGRSLIEATLAGLPIVAYDRDWQFDFITKNGAGVIVPFRDWKKMAAAAIHLIQNPGEAKQIAAYSRQTGLEACDVDKIYEHERNEFNKLLKR
jgi:glycosyltransferase involved in cell wall biosynthesis